MAQKKYTEEEARQRKNARQREYSKRTNHAAQAKYNKEKGQSVAFRLFHPQDDDIIQKLNKVDSKAGYIKSLIRADMKLHSDNSTDQK